MAEASSIRTGIPFGWYYYVPATVGEELWIAGVPLFDSISFPFLLVSSYGLAWWILSDRGEGVKRPRPGRVRHLLLATTLFVLADVIIDPVALRGDRWFLGQICAGGHTLAALAWSKRENLARLEASLAAIRMRNPHSVAEWDAIFTRLLQSNGTADQSIYLQITRGVAPRRSISAKDMRSASRSTGTTSPSEAPTATPIS